MLHISTEEAQAQRAQFYYVAPQHARAGTYTREHQDNTQTPYKVMSQPNNEEKFLIRHTPPEVEVVQGRHQLVGSPYKPYPDVIIEETGPSTDNEGRGTAVFVEPEKCYNSSSDATHSHTGVYGIENSNIAAPGF